MKQNKNTTERLRQTNERAQRRLIACHKSLASVEQADQTERLRNLLCEFADALDKDRGHSSSMVTGVMRTAAGRLDALAAERKRLRAALEDIIDASRDFTAPSWYAANLHIEHLAREALEESPRG